MATEPTARCTVVFRGHVQGVCFRATTVDTARPFPVTGYVMNLRDGSVRMVAEGQRADVSALIRGVLHEMSGYVTDHSESWGAATGEFRDFSIRYEGR